MRLKLERFGLPNKPSETPAPVWAMVRNRKISHAEHRNLLKEGFGAETEGERSEPGGRAFWRKAQRNGRAVRGSEAAKRLEHERFRGDSAVRCRS